MAGEALAEVAGQKRKLQELEETVSSHDLRIEDHEAQILFLTREFKTLRDAKDASRSRLEALMEDLSLKVRQVQVDHQRLEQEQIVEKVNYLLWLDREDREAQKILSPLVIEV